MKKNYAEPQWQDRPLFFNYCLFLFAADIRLERCWINYSPKNRYHDDMDVYNNQVSLEY